MVRNSQHSTLNTQHSILSSQDEVGDDGAVVGAGGIADRAGCGSEVAADEYVVDPREGVAEAVRVAVRIPIAAAGGVESALETDIEQIPASERLDRRVQVARNDQGPAHRAQVFGERLRLIDAICQVPGETANSSRVEVPDGGQPVSRSGEVDRADGNCPPTRLQLAA